MGRASTAAWLPLYNATPFKEELMSIIAHSEADSLPGSTSQKHADKYSQRACDDEKGKAKCDMLLCFVPEQNENKLLSLW